MKTGYLLLILVFILLNVTLVSHAAVYKCVDDDGQTTYSQSPCPTAQQSKVLTVNSVSNVNTELCEYVGRYATDVAISMRRGADSRSQIDKRGGINHISKGAMAIINHVYFYKANKNVGPTKIGAVAQSKCTSGAFSEFKRQDIPEEYFEPDPEELNRQQNPVAVPQQQFDQKALQEQLRRLGVGGGQGSATSQADIKKSQCAMYESQMKQLNATMRSGYSSQQGESYRDQRRELRSLMRKACK